MNISAISQHLRKLKDGNIVDVRKEGQTYFYFVKNDFLPILESIFSIIKSKRNILIREVS
jgi:DNA-binding transcriptional ArsR family regulator